MLLFDLDQSEIGVLYQQVKSITTVNIGWKIKETPNESNIIRISCKTSKETIEKNLFKTRKYSCLWEIKVYNNWQYQMQI